jgi:transporter family-2 protein
MQFVSILPLAMGIFIASQTAINSRLTSHNHLPLVTSTVSFATGSLFLGILTLCSGQGLGIRLGVMLNTPWWSWLGGLTAAFALTCNILLFRHLGSVETTLYPVIGQIIMSLVIDQFGWFGSLQQRMTWHKGLGAVLLLIGLLIFINLVSFHRTVEGAETKLAPQFGWQLLGVLAGIALAVQNAVNAQLGQAFHSPLHAAFISFAVSFTLLLLFNLVRRVGMIRVIRQTLAQQSMREWWIWLGGLLGSSYVGLSSILVPILGTGQVVILALFGQLVFSALIQQFGWFNSRVIKMNRSQGIGTVVMFVGILLIKF